MNVLFGGVCLLVTAFILYVSVQAFVAGEAAMGLFYLAVLAYIAVVVGAVYCKDIIKRMQ